MSKLCYGALVICITIAAVPLGAQNFGEITGTVTDATGAVVSGAAVTVTSATTNQVRRAVTNETGNYSVPFLVPGVYDLRAESSGFKVAVRKGVGIEVAAVARIDFNLEVGEVSQQVEVSGGAPLLATENTALGTVIENRRIVDLPLNGRNYLQLVTLSPNVTTEGGAGGSYSLGGLRAQTSLSIAGQRLEFNRYTLDGIENTDPNWNSWIIGPSVDALQEFKVQTGVYSAEFGRGSSQINVTTKAGSNEYHGAAFEFLRNSSLDARQWLQSQGNKNPFRRNQFGFTLGGPVTIPKVLSGHDKLFFMSNLEELRDRLTTQVSASVAPDVMRNGDFSAAGRNIFDPLTRTYNEPGIAVSATQFPGNVIPQSRLDPVAQRMLRFFPSPNQPGTSLVRNFLRNASQPTDSTQFNQRVDWLQNNKSTWFGRFSWADDFQQAAASFLTDTMHVASVARQAMISNTRILSTSTVNEARFAWNQFNNDLSGYFANTEDIQGSLGINGLFAPSPLGFGVPAIGLRQGISSFGGVTPWIARDDTFQFMDNVSIVRGRHSLKFGGEIRRDRYNEFGNSKITGEFIFDAQATFDPTNRNATGFAFADYMLGLPAQSARSIAMADTMLRRSGYYAYVQDDWKITPRLTLNLGVRYENARPWHDKYRGIMNAQLFGPGVDANGIIANSKSPIFTRPGNGDFYQGLNFHFADGQAVQSGDQYMGHSLVNPDNNNFAPRVGLSYSPSNRWTIRTGGGVFYVQDTANPTFDMGAQPGRPRPVHRQQRAAQRGSERSLGAGARERQVHGMERALPGQAAGARLHSGQPHALRGPVDAEYPARADRQSGAGGRLSGKRRSQTRPVPALQSTGRQERGQRHANRRPTNAVACLGPHSGGGRQRQLKLPRAQRQTDAAVQQRPDVPDRVHVVESD